MLALTVSPLLSKSIGVTQQGFLRLSVPNAEALVWYNVSAAVFLLIMPAHIMYLTLFSAMLYG